MMYRIQNSARAERAELRIATNGTMYMQPCARVY
jgi:hypothetical protein